MIFPPIICIVIEDKLRTYQCCLQLLGQQKGWKVDFCEGDKQLLQCMYISYVRQLTRYLTIARVRKACNARAVRYPTFTCLLTHCPFRLCLPGFVVMFQHNFVIHLKWPRNGLNVAGAKFHHEGSSWLVELFSSSLCSLRHDADHFSKVNTANGCNSFLECDDTSHPAGYLILNAFVSISNVGRFLLSPDWPCQQTGAVADLYLVLQQLLLRHRPSPRFSWQHYQLGSRHCEYIDGLSLAVSAVPTLFRWLRGTAPPKRYDETFTD